MIQMDGHHSQERIGIFSWSLTFIVAITLLLVCLLRITVIWYRERIERSCDQCRIASSVSDRFTNRRPGNHSEIKEHRRIYSDFKLLTWNTDLDISILKDTAKFIK